MHEDGFNEVWGTEGFLGTHKPFVKNHRPVLNYKDLEIGDIISFMYANSPRYTFVIHSDWDHKFHALDLKYIDRQLLVGVLLPKLDIIEDPKIFYETVYKLPRIYALDAYRTYSPLKMETIMQYEYEMPSLRDNRAKTRYIDTTAKNPRMVQPSFLDRLFDKKK